MVKYKRLTKGRSVTIPKDIAAAAGITGGTAVDLINADDMIMIRRHIPACVFCGNDVTGKEYKLCEKTVCAACAKQMREELDWYDGKNN